MGRVQFLERAAAEEKVAVAHRPEGEAWALQPANIKGVDALRRGKRIHIAQMLVEQGAHIGSGGVVDLDTHETGTG